MDVAYNELDAAQPMNRHGAICQVQRLAKSLITIFRTPGPNDTLGSIVMKTELDTDTVDTTYTANVPAGQTGWPNERWLFVNGIGGEYHWLRLSCDKLAAKLGRKVVGVFNRGDGLLWDLIECAGERMARLDGTTSSQDRLIEGTQSSRDARDLLKTTLRTALGVAEDNSPVTHPVSRIHWSIGRVDDPEL